MAKIFIVNKQVKGSVVIGKRTLDFSKGVTVLDNTVDEDNQLVAKISAFPKELGYEVMNEKEFDEKYLAPARAKKAAQDKAAAQKTAEETLTDEQKKAIWKEKQEKVDAKKQEIAALKKEFDEIPDDAEDAQAKKDAVLAKIATAESELKELQK